jgi:aquaporin Z
MGILHTSEHGLPSSEEEHAQATATQTRSYAGLRRLLAELLGTFALTLVAAGGPVMAAATDTPASLPALVVAPALLVMALIYSLGNLSGAHFNPVVTLAFSLRQDFPWRRIPGYWTVQLVGAVLAALLLRALFGTVGHLGATLPHHGQLASVVMEAVLTFLLLTVILATATNHSLVGHNAALAVAGTIALDGLFAAPVSGASMNPARSFGPALVDGQLGTYWIYVAGPVAGAVLAVVMAWLLRGGTSAEAMDAAQGQT